MAQTQQEHQQAPNPHVNAWACDEQEHYRRHGVTGSSSFFISPRGLRLFTRTFEPAHAPASGCICMIHGYTNDVSWSFQNTAIRFATIGFAAFCMDIEGHGFSDGLKGFVPNLDLVAEDFYAFFSTQKQNDSWLAPTWGVVPTKELRPLSFKDPAKLELSLRNPNRYEGKPRLGTAREMMRVTSYLSQLLHEVSLPFIVMHGGGDVVTDPEVSKALYTTAKSTDKTLKLYDGMLHALLAGEYDADVDAIFTDIQSWLKERVSRFEQKIAENGVSTKGDPE